MILLQGPVIAGICEWFKFGSVLCLNNYVRQMCDVPFELFPMSWTLWTYRAAGTRMPSTFYDQRLQFVASDMYVLSQIQNEEDIGA